MLVLLRMSLSHVCEQGGPAAVGYATFGAYVLGRTNGGRTKASRLSDRVQARLYVSPPSPRG